MRAPFWMFIVTRCGLRAEGSALPSIDLILHCRGCVSRIGTPRLSTPALRMTSLDVLTGPRVTLREITAEDIDDYPSAHAGDYDAFSALWGRPPHPREKAAGA